MSDVSTFETKADGDISLNWSTIKALSVNLCCDRSDKSPVYLQMFYVRKVYGGPDYRDLQHREVFRYLSD